MAPSAAAIAEYPLSPDEMTTDKPELFCHLCWLPFSDSDAFQSHQAEHHPFYCALCDCDFASDDALQHHLANAMSHNHVARALNRNEGRLLAPPIPPRQQVRRRDEIVLGGPEIYDSPSEYTSDNETSEDPSINAPHNERRVVVLPNIGGFEGLTSLREIRGPELQTFVQLWRETALQLQQQSMTYRCNICLNEPRLDSGRASRLSPCNHIMCRDCLRQFVISKLHERKYPIPCPDCSAENKPIEESRLSDGTINNLYLNDSSLQIYKELQLEQLAVRLYCNSCERSVYIPEPEFQTMPFFNCTFCRYRWCGRCGQGIIKGEKDLFVPHSCDGSEEFGYLRVRKGWRICPNPSCRATVEKTSGCNELNCRCGRTFCYGCGLQRDNHDPCFPCGQQAPPPIQTHTQAATPLRREVGNLGPSFTRM